MRSYSDQIVLTGGSSEIGTAILKLLQACGTDKVITTCKSKPIKAAAPNWCVLESIDLTREADLTRLRQEVEDRFSGPFSIIHAVGQFWQHKPLDRTPLSEARQMIMSHYLTLFGVARFLLPVAARSEGARLVAFSCNSVIYNYPEMAAFTAAKAAVECLVKCIANEWSGQGIIANAIALPTIRTDQVLKLKPNGDHENYIRPEELAQMVLGVLRHASDYMNGNAIKILKYSPSFYHEAYFSRNPPYDTDAVSAEPARKRDPATTL